MAVNVSLLVERMVYLAAIVGFFLCIKSTNGENACLEDQKLTTRGQCVDCKLCPPGKGVDLEVKIQVNEEGTPLECLPCKTCKPGFWNHPKTGQMVCGRCKNCLLQNRKQRESCGGSRPGRCGACINSDYEDKDQNMDSPCTNRTANRIRPEIRRRINSGKPPKDGSYAAIPATFHERHSKGLSIDRISLIIVISGIAVIAVIVLSVRYVVHKRRPRRPRHTRQPKLAYETSSCMSILSDVTSGGGWSSNLNSTRTLNNDTDLETDGLMSGVTDRHAGATNSGPHQELSLSAGLRSSGPEGIHPVVVYPQLHLKENDKFINYTSKNIYDEEKINPMFEDLGASGQTIYEQKDLYLHQKQTYNDMVLHLLQNWVRRAGRGATLDVLCQMLKQHGFYPVTIELLAISNEQH